MKRSRGEFADLHHGFIDHLVGGVLAYEVIHEGPARDPMRWAPNALIILNGLTIRLMRRSKMDHKLLKIMNKSLFFRDLMLFFLVCSAGDLTAAEVQAVRDEVKITATSRKNDSGRLLIRSSLFNGSQFPICATNLQTGSGAFHFKLLDASGNEVVPDSQWANEYAQKSSRRYQNPLSSRVDQVSPGEETSFEFILEEAYGDGARLGVAMMVSWESYYPDPTLVSSSEKYMFPERWSIVVGLPFDAEGERVLKNTSALASDGIKKYRDKDLKEKSKSISYWWLMLVPLGLLLRCFWRAGKVATKG